MNLVKEESFKELMDRIERETKKFKAQEVETQHKSNRQIKSIRGK